MSFALAMVGSSPTAQWAAILTILAEGLVISGFVIGVCSALLRWQKKKDRLEEEQDREQVKHEVRTQMEGFQSDFREYFETRVADLTVGIDRTVKAVEENTGTSIPDALARIERRQGAIDETVQNIQRNQIIVDHAVQNVVLKVEELERRAKFGGF